MGARGRALPFGTELARVGSLSSAGTEAPRSQEPTGSRLLCFLTTNHSSITPRHACTHTSRKHPAQDRCEENLLCDASTVIVSTARAHQDSVPGSPASRPSTCRWQRTQPTGRLGLWTPPPWGLEFSAHPAPPAAQGGYSPVGHTQEHRQLLQTWVGGSHGGATKVQEGDAHRASALMGDSRLHSNHPGSHTVKTTAATMAPTAVQGCTELWRVAQHLVSTSEAEGWALALGWGPGLRRWWCQMCTHACAHRCLWTHRSMHTLGYAHVCLCICGSMCTQIYAHTSLCAYVCLCLERAPSLFLFIFIMVKYTENLLL